MIYIHILLFIMFAIKKVFSCVLSRKLCACGNEWRPTRHSIPTAESFRIAVRGPRATHRPARPHTRRRPLIRPTSAPTSCSSLTASCRRTTRSQNTTNRCRTWSSSLLLFHSFTNVILITSSNILHLLNQLVPFSYRSIIYYIYIFYYLINKIRRTNKNKNQIF